MIYKITVFIDGVMGDLPSLIFWVEDVPAIYGEQQMRRRQYTDKAATASASNPKSTTDIAGEFQESKVARESVDRRSMLREHVRRIEV